MKFKTPVSFVITLMLLSTAYGSVSAGKPQQDVFDVVMMIQVIRDGSAHIDVSVKLISPVYREEIREGEKFERLVEELVYRNLLDDFRERYGNFTVYLPPKGSVEITGNWTARVSFYLVPFLTEGKRGFECPYSGPLDFVAGGKVYSFTFRRIILVLPKNATVVYTFPKPSDRWENVLIWENADYIPMVGVSYEGKSEENNETGTCRPLKIYLHYSPEEGKVFFNATYRCDGKLPTLESAKNITYIKRGNIIEVRGYFIPAIQYRETLFRKEWKARIKLPEAFPKVVGGEVENGGRIVEITVKHSSPAKTWLPPAGVLVIVLLTLWRWRK